MAEKTILDRFAENYVIFGTQFFSTPICRRELASLFAAAQGVCPDAETLRETAQLIRTAGGAAASRESELSPLLCAMCLSASDPDRLLVRAEAATRALTAHFLPAPQVTVAAFQLAESGLAVSDFPDAARRASLLHDRMSKLHPLITGYEDIPLDTLHAIGGENDAAILLRAEYCDDALFPERRMTNAAQALMLTLALLHDPQDAAAKAALALDALACARVKLGRGWQRVALAAIAGAGASPEAIAARAFEFQKELRKKNGFGLFGAPAKDQAYLCCMLACAESPAENSTLRGAFLAAVGANIFGTLDDLPARG